MATKYENYITGDDTSDPIQDVYWCWAQAFTPITTHRITSVKFKGYRVGSPGTITAKIMNFSELPNGAYLCSGEYNGNILPLVAGWFEVTLGDGCVVTVGQQYRIQLYAPGVTETDYMGLRIDITAPTYSGGRLWWGYLAGNGWYSLYGGIEIDAMFEEWGHAVSAGNADVILECAFNQSTFVDPDLATWTDVTPELMSLNTHRGRQHALDRIEAGTASFIMDNQSGNWWRYNTAGAYYGTTGDVKPLTPIRLRPYYGGTQYPLWYGMIEKIVPSWLEEGGYVPIAELQCVDLFKSLALFNLNQNLLLANASSGQKVIVVSRAIGLSAGQSIYIIDTEHNESRIIDTIVGNTITFTANLTNAYTTAKGAYTSFGLELSGARIGHILDVLGWPTAARIIATGQNYVIGLPIPTG